MLCTYSYGILVGGQSLFSARVVVRFSGFPTKRINVVLCDDVMLKKRRPCELLPCLCLARLVFLSRLNVSFTYCVVSRFQSSWLKTVWRENAFPNQYKGLAKEQVNASTPREKWRAGNVGRSNLKIERKRIDLQPATDTGRFSNPAQIKYAVSCKKVWR